MTEDRSTTTSSTSKPKSAKSDAGAAQVQATVEEELEQGFRGTAVDPTPNENYTVEGVTSGAPTPETTDFKNPDKTYTGYGEELPLPTPEQ